MRLTGWIGRRCRRKVWFVDEIDSFEGGGCEKNLKIHVNSALRNKSEHIYV